MIRPTSLGVQLARAHNLPYPDDMFASSHQQPGKINLTSASSLAVIAGVGIVFLGTIALWVAYGDRVYFDTIMTGLASCFSF